MMNNQCNIEVVYIGRGFFVGHSIFVVENIQPLIFMLPILKIDRYQYLGIL
ncbi:MAG: hypothetical protein IGNPGNKH_00624 [Sodalis sp. Ffu]|nr:MAG: hypothetical protein IGNPGNKH_00624 [Sodalis sp. Ffu]